MKRKIVHFVAAGLVGLGLAAAVPQFQVISPIAPPKAAPPRYVDGQQALKAAPTVAQLKSPPTVAMIKAPPTIG